MKLPLKYTETMKALLGEEYDAYLASFDEERFYGLRVNTLKLSAEEMGPLAMSSEEALEPSMPPPCPERSA